MFERFTDRARRVVVLAQEEARVLNHAYIGTEHLVLGLAHEGEGIAAQALTALGVDLPALRARVEEIIGRGPAPPSGHIPFTPRAKKVLEYSLREAQGFGHNYIGTEHILLGLLREGEGVGVQALEQEGASASDVRAKVHAIATESPDPPAPPRGSDEPRLTEREIEISRRVAAGESHTEIAKALFISEETVRNHLRNVEEKIALGKRGAARGARPHVTEVAFEVTAEISDEPVGPRCGGCGGDLARTAALTAVAVPGPGEAHTDLTFLYCARCGWIVQVRWPPA